MPSILTANNYCRFKICVDSETNVRVSVYQDSVIQKDCGLTYGLEQSDQINHISCGAGGDMIKLSKNSGNIVVYEVVIVGPGKSLSKFGTSISNDGSLDRNRDKTQIGRQNLAM